MNKNKKDRNWLDLISQCRASGLTDRQWCIKHSIAPSTFYYHVRILRKEACEVPAAHRKKQDNRQEVVSINFSDERPLIVSEPASFPAVRISLHGMSIEILNHAEEPVISNTLLALQKLC